MKTSIEQETSIHLRDVCMQHVADAGQPAIAPPVASWGSLDMIAVEHRAHMRKQQQQQGVAGQQLHWYVQLLCQPASRIEAIGFLSYF